MHNGLRGWGYQPSLDGVRAVAVMSVIATHAFRTSTSSTLFDGGGVAGVETFFALSGFLITTLLLQEWSSTGRLSMRNFYARRGLRLLPALAVAIAAVAVYALFQPNRGNATASLHATPSVAFYYANWWRAAGNNLGYFSHTWSLAIEEQFYLVWPVLLLAMLSRFRSLRVVAAITGAGVVLSTVVRVIVWDGGASGNRVQGGFDTRASGLLLGCLVAILLSRRPDGIRLPARAWSWISAAAFAALLVATQLKLPEEHATYTWGLTAIDVAALALIVAVVLEPRLPVARLLSLAPIVWIGRISYGLYIWHYIVIKVMAPYVNRFTPITRLALDLIVSFVVAAISYRIVEQPALRLKRRFASVPVEPLPAAAAAT